MNRSGVRRGIMVDWAGGGAHPDHALRERGRAHSAIGLAICVADSAAHRTHRKRFLAD
jgi:hypothetical protein